MAIRREALRPVEEDLLRCIFPAGSDSGTKPNNHRDQEVGIVIRAIIPPTY